MNPQNINNTRKGKVAGTKVAVVILNWNGLNMLRQYLPSVTSLSPEAEVYVADNASTDDSMTFLAEQYPQVHTMVLDRNYGFAEGYNRALQQIDAQYYVLLNSDVEVAQHWLAPLIAWMDAHDDTAACQPKILSVAERDRFEYAGAAGGFMDRLGYPFCRGRVFSSVERDRRTLLRSLRGDRPLLAHETGRTTHRLCARKPCVPRGGRHAAQEKSDEDVSQLPKQPHDALQKSAGRATETCHAPTLVARPPGYVADGPLWLAVRV